MRLAQKIAGGMLSLAVGQILRRLVSIGVTAALARALVPEDFGLVALTTVAVQLIGIFTETGLTTALVQHEDVRDQQFQTAFWINLAVCSSFYVLGVLAAPALAMIYKEPRIVPLIRVMLLTLPITSMGQIADVILQRRLAFPRLAAIELGSSFVSGVVAVLLAVAGFGVSALVAQTLTFGATSALAKILATGWTPAFTFQLSEVSPLFRFGLSVLGCGLVNYAVVNMQTIVIGRRLGVTDLGYYTLALNLVMLPATAIGGLVSRVMFPALSSVQKDQAVLQRGYLRMLRTVSAVTFPAAVGLGVTASAAVHILYGAKWEPVIPLLQVLTVWGLFQAINLSGVIFYAKAQARILFIYAAGSCILITAAVWIGASWGALGVAWSLVAVSPAVCIGPHVLAARIIQLPWRALITSVAPTLGAALMMGGVIVVCHPLIVGAFTTPWARMGFLVVVGAGVYGVSLTLIGTCAGHGRRLVPWLLGVAVDSNPATVNS